MLMLSVTHFQDKDQDPLMQQHLPTARSNSPPVTCYRMLL